MMMTFIENPKLAEMVTMLQNMQKAMEEEYEEEPEENEEQAAGCRQQDQKCVYQFNNEAYVLLIRINPLTNAKPCRRFETVDPTEGYAT